MSQQRSQDNRPVKTEKTAMTEIVEYRDEFREQIIELILTIQNDEFNIGITIDQQQDLLNINDFYQSNLGNFWVAVVDEKAVGTIALLDIANQQVALRKLFVEKNYRGKQFQAAALLLNTALQWSETNDIKEIFLGTTSKYHAAHRFYEKNNFKEILKTELPVNFPVMEVDTKFYNYKV